MTRILVPVDFSKASVNAAEYAIAMAGGLEKAELVLFHVYAPSGIGSDGSPVNMAGDKSKQNAAILLEELQVHLYNIAPVPTDFRYGEGDFLTGIRNVLSKEHFDWIVMGISPASGIEERLLGSSVFDVIEKNNIPVLVVGEGMVFKPVKKIAIAVELVNVHQVIPFGRIKMLLDTFAPELHFVCATEGADDKLTEAQQQEKQTLLKMFVEYNPRFTNLNLNFFVDSMNTFVHQHDIDLLVLMPRKLSIWQKIFGFSHTRKLAFHGVAPVVAIHD